MSAKKPQPMVLIDFGLTDYQAIWDLQHDLVKRRLAGEIPDTVLIGEHYPVVTLGRKAKPSDVLNPSCPVIAIERGGEATYHGPGQLLIYPIMHLTEGQQDLHAYLRLLEDVTIMLLGQFGLDAQQRAGLTGVWVDETRSGFADMTTLRKIASVGVAVKKWVTYHGVSVNVNTDLSQFGQINPCGMQASVMTSLAQQLGELVEMDIVKKYTQRCLAFMTGREVVPLDFERLMDAGTLLLDDQELIVVPG